jgi:DNA-binding CsgD family transcriptional regulator
VPFPTLAPPGLAGPRASALILITDPARERPPNQWLLGFFYGLTPTEAQIAAQMVVGRRLEDIASDRGLTLETARWYSKQILAKTGCHSRVELARQVSRTLASLFPDAQVTPAVQR